MISALLNKKILIQKGEDTTSAVLSPDIEFTDYMETWANVYDRASRVSYADSEELIYTTEFTVRYTNKTKLINNKYRIKYDDEYYRILTLNRSSDIIPNQSIKFITERYDT